MKRILVCLLTIYSVFTVAFATNTWVFDESDYLSEGTEEHIANLNENVFSNYQSKPQLGVIVIDNLPEGESMDSYKLKTFNSLGVGNADTNCGILFVMAINDRAYGLEIGDGFETGTTLRSLLETDFVDDKIKSYFRSEDYDSGIYQVVLKIEEIMLNQENGYYTHEVSENEEFLNNLICIGILLICSVYFMRCGFKNLALYLVFTRLKKSKTLEIFKYKMDSDDIVSEVLKKKGIFKSICSKNYEFEVVSFYYDVFIPKLLVEKLEGKKYNDRLKYFNVWGFIKSEYDYRFPVKDFDTCFQDIQERISHITSAIEKYVSNNLPDEEYTTGVLLLSEKILGEYYSIDNAQSYNGGNCASLDSLIQKTYHELKSDIKFEVEYNKFIEYARKKVKKHGHPFEEYFDEKEFKYEIKNSQEYRKNRYIDSYSYGWMYILLIENIISEKNYIESRSKNSSSSSSRDNYFGGGFGGGSSSGGGFSGGW